MRYKRPNYWRISRWWGSSFKRAKKEEVLALSPKFEFLRRGKAIMFSGRYATHQGTVRSSYLGV